MIKFPFTQKVKTAGIYVKDKNQACFYMSFFFFLVKLGFELKASHLKSRLSQSRC
jgi:hypothetical protein